jgi:citrate lyase subunit beta / citryl-CoA lyase
VVWPGLARVNYPKAETAEEIRKLDVIITRLERERGIRPGTVEIGANIETARGVANALEIVAASPRIKDFGGGGGYDMSRDLGVEMFVGFDQFTYGKGKLELTTRAVGVAIHRAGAFVPNTTGSVSDADRAFREAEASRKCGFREGGGLHPNVIEPQNRGFTPTATEVTDAKWVLERYQALQRAGKVWEETDGRVIDVYEAQRAEELLEWAELCAERNVDKAEAVARTKVAEQR